MELTLESIKALLADELGRRAEEDKQARYKEYVDFTKDLKSNIDSTLNGFTARIDKEVTAKIGNISSGFEELKQFQSELKSALEAPDPDPTTSEAPNSQASTIDFDKMLEEKTRQIEESFKKTYGSKIKALEDTVDTERQEKLAITQKQIDTERDNGFLNILKTIAPKVNLYDNHEDLAFERLRRDQRLQASEDGKSWMVKTKQKNAYTGQEEELLLPPDENNLASLLSQEYAMYIKPRSGVGSNATTTQPYRQQSNRSPEQLLDSASSNSGDFDLDAIANAIANG